MENLHIVNTDKKWIRVAHFTMVVRNASLKSKYPGGIRTYLEKHGAQNNNLISVSCFMGDDIDEVFMDLRSNGLKPGGDFTIIDVGATAIAITMDKLHLGISEPQSIETKAPWLRCRYTPDGIFVRYTDQLDEDEFVLEALRIIGIDPLEMGYESYRIVREVLLSTLQELGYEDAIENVRGSAAHQKGQIEYLMSLAD